MSDDRPAGDIRVTVAYALPERQWLVELELPAGATVADAVARSQLAAQVPGWNPSELGYAIFARPVQAETALADGDRVELLRPLTIDPMQARRLRAQRRGL